MSFRAKRGTCFFLFLKVKMMMRAASRIERGTALWTSRFAFQIRADRQLRAASSAQNRPLLPLAPRPHLNRVPRQSDVAILAGVVHPATFHFDGDNVRRRVIVQATRLRVEINSAHTRSVLTAPLRHFRFWFSAVSRPR